MIGTAKRWVVFILLFLLGGYGYAAPIEQGSHTVFEGDYDGNGLLDILLRANPYEVDIPYSVTLELLGDRVNYVLVAQSDGSFHLIVDPSNYSIEGVDWVISERSLVSGDFNGDGEVDLLITSIEEGSNNIYLTGLGSSDLEIFDIFSNDGDLGESTDIDAVDLDGDGVKEIIIESELGQQVYSAKADGSFAPFDTTSDLVGAVRGGGGVGPSGAAQYNIPLIFRDALGGLQPSLSLNYDSRSSDGLFGVGWSLDGLSSISRCEATLAQNGATRALAGVIFAETSTFCLDGQKLVYLGVTEDGINHLYHLEQDTSSRVILRGYPGSSSSYFEVKTRGGLTLKYGETSASNDREGFSGDVHRWALSSVADTFGNTYTVSYIKTNADLTPHIIDMPGSNMKIEFLLESNSQGPTLYRGRKTYSSPYLISGIRQIDTTTDTPIKEYQLTYSGRLLQSIAECGFSRGGDNPICSKPTQLGWSESTLGYQGGKQRLQVNTSGPLQSVPMLMDLNNDGLDDFVWAQNESWHVAHGNGEGFDAAIDTGVDFGARNVQVDGVTHNLARLARPIRLGNDHEMGILVPELDDLTDNEGLAYGLRYAIFTFNRVNGQYTGQELGARLDTLTTVSHMPIVADFNGDGREDIFSLIDPVIVEALSDYDEANNCKLNVFHSTLILRTDTAWDLESTGGSEFFCSGVKAPADVYQLDQDWYSTLSANTVGGIGTDLNPIPGGMKTHRAKVLDFNGDGLLDILLPSNTGWSIIQINEVSRYFNTDGQLEFHEAARNYNIGYLSNAGIPSSVGDGIVVDFNGDGLDDFAYKKSSRFYVMFNEGGKFRSAVQIASDLYSLGDFSAIDANGDGLMDIITTENVHINNNGKALTKVAGNNDFGSTFFNSTRIDALGWDITIPSQTIKAMPYDVDRDGLLDLVGFDTSGPYVIYHNGTKGSLLETVTTGYGHQERFQYRTLKKDDPSGIYGYTRDSLFPQFDLEGGITVVSEHYRGNGIGGENRMSYQYRDGKYHVRGRGFLGFKQVIETDHARGFITTTDYHQQFPFIGRPYQTTTKQISTNRLVTTQHNEWAHVGYRKTVPFLSPEDKSFNLTSINDPITSNPRRDSNPRLVYLDKSWVEGYEINDPSNTPVSVQFTDNDIDLYGNVTRQVIQIGQGRATNGVSGLKRTITTDRIFENDEENWRLGFLKEETITSVDPGSPARVVTNKYTKYSPDTLAVGTETVFSGTDVESVTSYNRDNRGVVTSSVLSGASIETRTTVTNSNFLAQYPRTIVNALGHSTLINYDLRFGSASQITDPNGHVTRFEYDPLGRQIKQIDPDGAETRVIMSDCDNQCPALGAYRVTTYREHQNKKVGRGQPITTVVYDQLGREIQTATETFTGKFSFVDIAYDELGRIASRSEPYFKGNTVYNGTFSYDVLDRPTSETHPDGTNATFIHSKDSTYARRVSKNVSVVGGDVSSISTYQQFDELGQMRRSVDANGVPVTMAYNAQGLLAETQVNGDAATTIEVTHDIAGNRTFINDPDAGAMTFSYDALGLLRTQTDAEGQTITFTYDKLNRMVMREDNYGGSTPQIETANWVYDAAPKGIGLLASVNAPGYLETYSYDALSRLSSVGTELLGGHQFTFNYGYDSFSRVSETRYPSGFGTLNRYDQRGFRAAVSDADNEIIYWQMKSMDARGQVTEEAMGNGAHTKRAFDPITGLITSIQTGKDTATDIQDLSYTFDSIGNLQSRQSVKTGLTVQESFNYDALNRLKQAATSGLPAGSRTLNYAYDALGNVTYKSDAADTNGMKYQSDKPHALTELVKGGVIQTLEYDNKGNVIRYGSRSIDYNIIGKPVEINEGAKSVSFQYGPTRNRFAKERKTGGQVNQLTLYVGGAYEEVIDFDKGLIKSKNYAGSYMLKVFTRAIGETGVAKETQYLHRDHLGSIEAISEFDGLEEQFAYDPYGGRRKGSGEDIDYTYKVSLDLITFGRTTQGFTGHEHIDEFDLIHMGGRVFDPTAGRFLSPDIVVQHPHLSQSYNRYSYVLNNPLSATDPTGYIYELNDHMLSGIGVFNDYSTFNNFQPTFDGNSFNTNSQGNSFNFDWSPDYGWSGSGSNSPSNTIRFTGSSGGSSSNGNRNYSSNSSGTFNFDFNANYELEVEPVVPNLSLDVSGSGANDISSLTRLQGPLVDLTSTDMLVHAISGAGGQELSNDPFSDHISLASQLLHAADNTPQDVIPLTLSDIRTLADYSVAYADESAFYTSPLDFYFADSILYHPKLVSRIFDVQGIGQFRGGEINYIVVGAMFGRYGLSKHQTAGIVTTWNFAQFIEGREMHNLTSLPVLRAWAEIGRQYYNSRTEY